MKTQILSFAVLFGLIAGVFAEDATKPRVSLTVKSQLLSADRDDRGPRSESTDKYYTLRVVIKNLSDSTLEGAELTGDALVNRAVNDNEKIVKEALKSLKIPPMKPNENLTVDLGKFTLSKVKWQGRTFEETLEEWKVVCKKGEVNVGESESSAKYDALLKEMKEQKEEAADDFDEKKVDHKRKENFRRLRN